MLVLHLGERPFRRADDQAALLARGVRLLRVESEEEVIEHAKAYDYDALILDLDAAKGPGVEFIGRFRRTGSKLPILAVATTTDGAVRARALDLGADDVLHSLCEMDETLARLRAVLRRSAGHTQSVMRLRNLELHLDRRELRANGEPVRLTPKEYDLLELLFLKNGRPVSRACCLDHLYCGLEERDAKTVDVLVCRLRKKFALLGIPQVIENVWGRGFRLQTEAVGTEGGPPDAQESAAEAQTGVPVEA